MRTSRANVLGPPDLRTRRVDHVGGPGPARRSSRLLPFVLAVTLGTTVAVTGGTSVATAGSPPVPPPGWTRTYVQNFDQSAALGHVGTVYGPDMAGYTGFGDTSGHGAYRPDKVLSVADGHLDWLLHTESGQHLVAAPTPMGYGGQTYGRYSVRFRSDQLPGYKIAFLLWPTSDDWNQGEIDWPEGALAGRMSPASARVGSLDPQSWTMTFDPPQRVYSATDSSTWHIATTEWTPGLVRWFWDGVLVGRTTVAADVPSRPMR